VRAAEVSANTYFDGPFDQLPDNFIAATPFAELAQRAYPSTRGRIDRHGNFLGREGRLALLNYRIYVDPAALRDWIASCHAATDSRAGFYACLFAPAS
jgi:hypothetical protein